MLQGLRAPQPLAEQHRLDEFHCGERLLDEWLRRRARANQASGASRTFVVADGAQRVVGYYSLAAGSALRASAPGPIRRNMPEPIPLIVLGRLAVVSALQGRGLGLALLRDAVLRCQAVATQTGVRAILVHAMHEPAARFYRAHGFLPSPIDALTLMLPMPIPEAPLPSGAGA